MQRFVYLIIFFIIVLIIKAFFVDSYLKEKSGSEANASVETAQPEEVQSAPVENNISGMAAEKKKNSAPKQEGMPLDKLGDSIAEKIEDKL